MSPATLSTVIVRTIRANSDLDDQAASSLVASILAGELEGGSSNPDNLTVAEVAARIRKCEKTVINMIKAGLFNSRKIGRTWTVDRLSLEDYERRHTRKARRTL